MKVVGRVLFGVVFVSACSSGSAPPPEPSSRTATQVAEPTAAAAADENVSPVFDVAPQHRPSGDVEFAAVLDLNQQPVGNEPQLRGGRIAVSKDWPASLYVTFQTPDGTAACTAALVGPQAMLTAAHCVPRGGRVSFRYKGHSKGYATDCTQHPQYVSGADASADYALCKIDRAFAAPGGFRYETIDTSAMGNLALGTTLILTGYGCTSDIVASSQTDSRYRIGFNVIDERSDSPTRTRGAVFYAGREDNNLFTRDDPGSANVCPGDSGGPAFRSTGGGAQVTNRVIVGVNSRVFYRDRQRTSYGSSLVSATGGPDFRRWAEDWTTTAGNVSVCGVAGAIPNCRS